MLPVSRAFVACVLYSSLLISQPATAAESSPMTAIIGVNVIPMDEERILENQTVIIVDGRIAEIGNTDDVVVPDDAKRIEGDNRYLMPGLADLHTHLRGTD